jgi:hypothetical protein
MSSSASTPAPADGDFRTPFIGHLPGFREQSEAAGTGRPDTDVYRSGLADVWRQLLDSEASAEEALVHAFLERHPSLLPGPFSVDGTSGHGPYPDALISKPKLPGLTTREPDFMWIATDSATLSPILIEIETPHKQWFYGPRAEIHSNLTHAQGQLAEWRAWFRRGHNSDAFLDYFDVPRELRRRTMMPRYVLIHGRRANYERDPARLAKRAELAREDERLMSFDRLSPDRNAVSFPCVKKSEHGYGVQCVPPSFSTFSGNGDYQGIEGWDEALSDCPDMTDARREFLRGVLDKQPDEDRQREFKFRFAKWL